MLLYFAQNVLGDIEDTWLGGWKGLLLGNPANEDDAAKLHTAANTLEHSLPDLPYTVAKVLLYTQTFLT